MILTRSFVFSEDARRVLDSAAAEAERLNGNGIRSEHILLSLGELRHETGARALHAAGVDLDALPDHIVRAVRSKRVPWWMPDWESGLAPDAYSREAKAVLRFAMAEAADLGHRHVGTEHLLLGLLRSSRGVGARVLDALGVTLDGARAAVRSVGTE
jgi:ATP-dependent Clp protease ATP-binding subunit ClpC